MRALPGPGILSLVLLLGGCSCDRSPEPTERDPRWAVGLDRAALPNAFRISKDLYRGAQPGPEGFRELQRLGIRTVVNLRSMHSDQDEMREAGLADGDLGYVRIPMHAWHPEDEDLVRFLRIVSDASRTPVFVHCQHGADRTGVIVAAYRMVVEGWIAQDAIREMREGGYGFHTIWSGLPEYLEELDVARIRREAGLDG
jgi:protein tyrosine phosphatase (PTP) superfamily phosphohydrolase (DUF442 family)